MSDALPDDAEVASTLDDLIERLSKGKRTPDLRNALIEAKRLKSATARWVIIPPPPDARRELLERVTVLLALAPEADPRVPESTRRPPAEKKRPIDEAPQPSKRLVELDDETTKPAGRFPTIHDEETARMPSLGKTTSSSSRGAKAVSLHEEDTAPGPEARAAALSSDRFAAQRVSLEKRAPSEKLPSVSEEKDAHAKETARPPSMPSIETSALGPMASRGRAPTTRPPPGAPTSVGKGPSTRPPAAAPVVDKPRVERVQSAPILFASLDDLDLSDLELFSSPSGPSSLSAAPQLPPIVMPKLDGLDERPKIDGFSTSVSSPKLAAVRAPVAKRTAPLPAVTEGVGVTIVRGASAWRPHAEAAHVMLRTLHENADATTTLVRLPPNAQLPAKKVTTESALIVLLGSATMGPHDLSAGDSCRLEKHATRSAITTSGACTLLFVGAESDV